MTTLPPFVELMASLGLDRATKTPERTSQSTTSSPPSPATVAVPSLRTRPKSNQSLRGTNTTRQRPARFSPYSPVLSATRRGSLSSLSSSSSERDRSPLRAYSTSPRLSSSPRFWKRNNLSVNAYGSASDLAGNTPISIYVRRKTPGTSPTSPTFPRESQHDSPSIPPMPLTIPILPLLLPSSASSDSFPITPLDSELLPHEMGSPMCGGHHFTDIPQAVTHSRRIRHHNGVRISTPPRPADSTWPYPRRSSLAHLP